MIQTHSPTILEQLLEPVGHSMTPDLAKELIGLRASPTVQGRIDDLAEKCNEGTLSPEERAEYESCVQAILLIGILQRKAKAVLKGGARPE